MKNEENYTYDEYDDDYYYEEDDSVLDEIEEYENYQNDEYSYDDNDKNSLVRRRIIKAVIAVFVIGIVIFTGTRLLASGNNKPKDDSDLVTKVNNKKVNVDGDIENIKSSVLLYYTMENVPKEQNENTILTLNDLSKNNILPKLSSSSYDNENSYVKLINKGDKYILEIYLKNKETSKSKNYEVNNYKYCSSTYLCLKDDTLDNSNSDTDDTLENNTNEYLDDEEDFTTDLVEDDDDYLYKYIKNSSVKNLSTWSLWDSYKKTSCDTQSKTCSNDDINCLEEVKLYQRKERIGSYPRVYTAAKNSIKLTKTAKKQTCNNFDYVKINNNYYQLPLNSKYNDITKINANTRSSYGNFTYNGRKIYKMPPTDTINTYYVFVGIDNANCGDNCSNLPKYIYDSYTFNKKIKLVTKVKNCDNISNSSVPVYTIASETVSVTREEGLYGTVCYASTRTRNVLTSNNSDIKWSYYDNRELLDAGYIYSGEKK